MVSVLGRPVRGVSPVENHHVYSGLPRFRRRHTMVYVPFVFSQIGVNLFRTVTLHKKNLDESSRFRIVQTARVARHASFQTLLQEKTCNSAHEQTPLSTVNIDLFLRHWERFRAKDLSGAPRISNFHTERRAKMISANSHCENNKTLSLINTTFPPSTTSGDKVVCIWQESKEIKFLHQQNWQKMDTDQKKITSTYIMCVM